jgi:hypothetical protein
LGLREEAGRRGVRAFVVLFETKFRSAGKAVKNGHSCAAVTHHRPAPRRRETERAKPIRDFIAGEGAGEEGARSACNAQIPNAKFQNRRRLASRPLFLKPWSLGDLEFARVACSHAESEHLPPGAHAFAANFARGARENFIAKMKRESGARPATACGSALASISSRNP